MLVVLPLASIIVIVTFVAVLTQDIVVQGEKKGIWRFKQQAAPANQVSGSEVK